VKSRLARAVGRMHPALAGFDVEVGNG
jgi:hypothetical protein